MLPLHPKITAAINTADCAVHALNSLFSQIYYSNYDGDVILSVCLPEKLTYDPAGQVFHGVVANMLITGYKT